ncbi:MAG: SusD/RagB family nutrient-binding outer membrane lipoprotein [Bacteroidetes bacterium]|nr:SusD/RagB family nutrient-binding outer membrane lipoprotein [Bacteroidota bacterium]
MKTKIISGLLCLATCAMIGSCDKWIDSSINVDPNNLTSASLKVILPTAEAGLAYQMGGDIGRYVGLFNQHYTGVSRQSAGYYGYTFTESDDNNIWEFNMYAGCMKDMSDIITIARNTGAPHYQGVGEVLMAYSLGTMSDLWGDIPYADCFKGNGNLTPAYQSQQEIYSAIQNLLDSALIHCSAAASNFKPGADDLVFGGKMANWSKTASVLKARYALHLAKQDAAGYTKALAALDAKNFAGNADDAQFIFGSLETEANPLYQFMDQRGDISMGPVIIALMDTLDPRLPKFAGLDATKKYSQESAPGAFYASINSPVPFVTYAEAKFIEAEAAFQTGNKARAHTAFVEGITASCAKTGADSVTIAAFLKMPKIDPGEANLTLQKIMEQKYVALFTMAESWTDWRRTGFPTLTPITGSQVPRRFPYPLSERTRNRVQLEKVSAGVSLFSRVWWDKP